MTHLSPINLQRTAPRIDVCTIQRLFNRHGTVNAIECEFKIKGTFQKDGFLTSITYIGDISKQCLISLQHEQRINFHKISTHPT